MITTKIVDTGVRKIRANCTREMAADLSMYQIIVVEKELEKAMRRKIRISKIKRIITC